MYFIHVPATTGTGNFITDPLNDCWFNLMVAIYKECIDDLVYGANHHDQASAKAFLKENPYGLNIDFDTVIAKKKEEIKKCK